MKTLLILSLLLLSLNSLAMTKGEVDKVIASCSQKSMRKIFRGLMEHDLSLKPRSRTLVILLNKFEKQDLELVFDDTPFRTGPYHTLLMDGAMVGRFKYWFRRPVVHRIKYFLSSSDNDGHIKTDLKLSYTPRSNPNDIVELYAEYLPSVIYNFENLIRDNFGRIAPESTIRTFKVRSHPIHHTDVSPLKEVSSGEVSGFSFASKEFMECIQGAQI